MPPAIDLSNLTKLKDLEFELFRFDVRWITATLQTANSNSLWQITIHSDIVIFDSIGETDRQEWRELDRLLVQLWTSRSIRPKFAFTKERGRGDLGDFAPGLLPELTSRGVVDLVWCQPSASWRTSAQ